jgi:hypothetical protein
MGCIGIFWRIREELEKELACATGSKHADEAQSEARKPDRGDFLTSAYVSSATLACQSTEHNRIQH